LRYPHLYLILIFVCFFSLFRNQYKNKKYTNSKLENECLIASLNARAVLFSSLISNNNNNNNSGTISSIGSLMPNSNMFNNNSANPFSMVANEYFTSYLQALNQSIQFEKVIIIF